MTQSSVNTGRRVNEILAVASGLARGLVNMPAASELPRYAEFSHSVVEQYGMQAIRVEHLVRRATGFFEGMELTRSGEPYLNSSALLAIHSAISYSDALRVGLGDDKLNDDDHKRAAEALQRILRSKDNRDDSGIQHFRYLLSKKHVVTYGDQRLDRTDYEALFTKAERFARWADMIGIQLKIEGWQDASR